MLKGFHPIVIAAAADIVATVIIFASSIFLDNSSMYDPYWSLIPIVIAFYFVFNPVYSYAADQRIYIVIGLVLFWALRLTFNWMRHWEGLGHEDWRYVDLRKEHGKMYWAVSFAGIHFFPTVLVFLGCLSLYPALSDSVRSWNYLDTIATVITLGAILIEMISDNQLSTFQKTNEDPQQIMEKGLWHYSRHPNYFGEIMFWLGLFCFALAANPSYWWTAIGPLAMIFLFTFISIPMMERHMVAKRPHYDDHMNKVSAIIPWFRAKD
ncbi:MAG: DUF1295 domain-containing protein [Bacteroidales bacterium]|nr:DUF1295 domain-containing protein [Bacteroidales bacterium]